MNDKIPGKEIESLSRDKHTEKVKKYKNVKPCPYRHRPGAIGYWRAGNSCGLERELAAPCLGC